MLEINGREAEVTVAFNGSFADWDDMFADAYVDYAEWADTGQEFTDAEYAEHERLLQEVAGELAWEAMV